MTKADVERIQSVAGNAALVFLVWMLLAVEKEWAIVAVVMLVAFFAHITLHILKPEFVLKLLGRGDDA